MKILAIETSCDETALALLDIWGSVLNPKIKIKKNVVLSQVKIHAPYGGVVPNLAKREHLKNLPTLLPLVVPFQKIIDSIDLIAVTVGPGLEPALWTGINFAKQLASDWKKPIVGASHLEGHLYSFLFSSKVKKIKKIFPAISLIISGGHTILAYMKDIKSYKKLGETLDDAVGESFDKVARLLNLPYPGGAALEKLAKEGNEDAIAFPLPMINQKNYNFSYSGLKTSVLYYLKSLGLKANDFSLSSSQKRLLEKIESQDNLKSDIAASFQKSAFVPLVKKSIKAAKEYKAKSILIGGGVAANKNIRKRFALEIKKEKMKLNLIVPPLKFCMDNAAMIALAAFMNYKSGKKYPLVANGNLNL
jgi:N6-L-threonylcarbamoyladenine synthase